MTEADGDRILESWRANAAAWTDAVRMGRISSRRLGTDAAIVSACLRVVNEIPAAAVLDAGCGEGWLTHVLANRAGHVVGIDASEHLVAAARQAGGGGAAVSPDFAVFSYEQLIEDRTAVPGPFDLIVCNYSLFDEPLAPTLGALAGRLSDRGRLVIQTVHPWAGGDGTYVDEWRVETFAAFEQPFASSMPWYFRTLSGWFRTLGRAGLVVTSVDEPLHPDTRKPLSLILTTSPARSARA